MIYCYKARVWVRFWVRVRVKVPTRALQQCYNEKILVLPRHCRPLVVFIFPDFWCLAPSLY